MKDINMNAEDTLFTPDFLIDLMEKVKKIRKENEHLRDQLGYYDKSKWYSIYRVSNINRIPREKISWRKLKRASEELGCDIKKIIDPNDREVNLYHVKAWEAAYPELEL